MSVEVPARANPHERTRRGPILYVVVIGVLLGIAGVWTAVVHQPSYWLVMRYVAVGLVYLGIGWWLSTKGFRRLGLVLAATGLVWFIPELGATDNAFLVGVGILFTDVYLATFAHAVLTYPNDPIRPRLGLWIVGAGYVLTLLGGTARALTYQPYRWESCECPHNGLALWHSLSVYNGVNDPYQIVGLILGIALIPLIAFKLRPAMRDGAPAMPVWAALVGAILVLVSGIVRNQADLSKNGLIVWLWVEGVGLLLVPLAMLVLGRTGARVEDRRTA
jgi:hypothetical protein